MDGRLFTTPDRIIAAAAAFTAGGFEGSLQDLIEPTPALALPEPAPWPTHTERPMRPMRSACRTADVAVAPAFG